MRLSIQWTVVLIAARQSVAQSVTQVLNVVLTVLPIAVGQSVMQVVTQVLIIVLTVLLRAVMIVIAMLRYDDSTDSTTDSTIDTIDGVTINNGMSVRCYRDIV